MLDAVPDVLGNITPIDVVQVLLLLVTIAISSASLSSQIRASIRESLEQLEPVFMTGYNRVQPILHRVSFVRWSTTVSLKLYPSSDLQSATRLTTVRHQLNHDDDGHLERALDEIAEEPRVLGYTLENDEIRFTIRSINPVKIRRITSEVLLYFEQTYQRNNLNHETLSPELEEQFE